METKRCPRCSEKAGIDVFVEVGDFYVDKARWDGLGSMCRGCRREYQNSRYVGKVCRDVEGEVPPGYKRCGELHCARVYPMTPEWWVLDTTKGDWRGRCKRCLKIDGKLKCI